MTVALIAASSGTPGPVVSAVDHQLATVLRSWLAKNPSYELRVQAAARKWLAAKSL